MRHLSKDFVMQLYQKLNKFVLSKKPNKQYVRIDSKNTHN